MKVCLSMCIPGRTRVESLSISVLLVSIILFRTVFDVVFSCCSIETESMSIDSFNVPKYQCCLLFGHKSKSSGNKARSPKFLCAFLLYSHNVADLFGTIKKKKKKRRLRIKCFFTYQIDRRSAILIFLMINSQTVTRDAAAISLE